MTLAQRASLTPRGHVSRRPWLQTWGCKKRRRTIHLDPSLLPWIPVALLTLAARLDSPGDGTKWPDHPISQCITLQ